MTLRIMKVRAFAAISVTLLVSACADHGPTPSNDLLKPLRSTSFSMSTDCEQQIIPDPECNTDGSGSTGYWAYHEEADGELMLEAAAYESNEESAPCPRWIEGTTTGFVRDPNTRFMYRFSSIGRWNINWLASLIYLPSSQAIYSWPQSPTGWWDAVNVDRGNSPAKIRIKEARGYCATTNVHFFTYYGVEVKDDQLRTQSSGSGGGGGSGDGLNCHQEYVFIEINYGDGTGWHVWWEGYASVCE
ncbi:MAG: hypothetical protein WD825_05620 [Gemmatimonadaceae bacterium]